MNDLPRYVLEHKHALQPEIRAVFGQLLVDEAFKATLSEVDVKVKGEGGGHFPAVLRGTVRASTCRMLAGEHADVCDQCRLLQDPIAILGGN